MHAIDVMTSDVISVDENATVPAVARLLAERGISAVPVVDKDNRVIGMVSEGDLLHRAETGTERRRTWSLDMMASTNKLAGDYIKSHSGKVKDVMTRNVLSVTETTPIADIALLLETNRIATPSLDPDQSPRLFSDLLGVRLEDRRGVYRLSVTDHRLALSTDISKNSSAN
jgi:CBS-domain-containing membrane protein